MKKRNSCDGCGIRLETDAKYCKYCGAERKEVPDDFVEEDGIQASTTKKIRYCKYCGRRFEKNIKQCSCEEKTVEDTAAEEKVKIAAAEIVEPVRLICEPEDEDTKYEKPKYEEPEYEEPEYEEPEYQESESEEWEYEKSKSDDLKPEEPETEDRSYEQTEDQKLNGEESDYEEDSLPQKKPIGKAVKIAAAVLMLGGAGAAGFFLSNKSESETGKNTLAQKNQSAVSEADNSSVQLATIAEQIDADDSIEILKPELSGDISAAGAETESADEQDVERAESESELARQESERAESEAERVRQESELARQESERAESEAERVRQESELARQESERAESEAERARQESERAKLESERAALEAEIERMEAELEAKRLEQEAVETPLYGYEGSYVCTADCTASILQLEDNTYIEIANHAILYVDEAKEKNGEKLGHTVYGGLEGWIDLSDYTMISYEDYSISEFTFCFAGGYESGGIALYTESDTASELIGMIPYGTELIIINQQNGMGYTYYRGQRGWVLLDDVLSYCSELAYQVVSEDGWISLMMQPNDSSNQVEEAYDGQTLLVDDWQEGWVKTAAWGTTGWVCMADLRPVGDAEFVDFAELEIPADEVTVWGDTTFYVDGTPVSEMDYILPDSASCYLTEEDLEKLTLKGICYAKNEIYARHGRIFKSQELRDYFEGQWWYDGIYEPNDSNDAKIVSDMNDYEYYNKDLLWKVEQQRGIYELDQ